MSLYVGKAVGSSVSIVGARRPGVSPACQKRIGSIVRRGDGVKSAWERAEEQREKKLELIREQIESGSLVIRKMTKEERRRYPRRSASAKHSSRR